MIKIPIVALLLLGSFLLLFFLLKQFRLPIHDAYSNLIHIGSVDVMVEIANTPETITRGLSGRTVLPDGKGMLFVFPSQQRVTFWMPDMNFPIDMIFIRNRKIVWIEQKVPNPPNNTPRDQLKLYSPDEPVDMVLEVPAGWSEKNGVSIGAELTLQ